MDRKVAGALVIVVAMVCTLALSVVARVGLPGTPDRAPVADPPHIGGCVSRAGSSIRSVPCSLPHAAEIADVWSPASTAPKDVSQGCQDAAARYLRVERGYTVPELRTTGWGKPPIRFVIDVAKGPGAVIFAGWSWSACLVAPVAPDVFRTGYTGRLVDLGTKPAAPAELRPCYVKGSSTRSGIGCGRAHLGEVLASRQLFLPADEGDARTADPAELAECTAIARVSTGAADPTYGGNLTVVVNLRAVGNASRPASGDGSSAAEPVDTIRYVADCAVEASRDRRLYKSVVGVGAGQLPLR